MTQQVSDMWRKEMESRESRAARTAIPVKAQGGDLPAERFARNAELRKRAAERERQERQPLTRDERIARNTQQHEDWISHSRSHVTSGGVTLDQKTIQAKEAYQKFMADKKAAKENPPAPPAPELSHADMKAIADGWEQAHLREFYGSAWNTTQILRCLQALIQAGRTTWSMAGFDLAFAYCKAHGHFESIRRIRGEAAPVEFKGLEN